MLDLDGLFVLTPMVPLVPELAREIKRARLEAGLSTKELLAALREQRERYHQEQYESAPTPGSEEGSDASSPDNGPE